MTTPFDNLIQQIDLQLGSLSKSPFRHKCVKQLRKIHSVRERLIDEIHKLEELLAPFIESK